MLGLTAIELAAMKGQSTDKARAAIAKEATSLARQRATEQQANAEREAGFAQLAESEIQAVTAQIKALVAQFIEPLQGYTASVNGLQGDYFVSHCRHAYEAGQQQAIRDQLTQTINEAQALIDAKLGENTQLAQSREPTEIGLIGVNLMDVEVLQNVIAKANDQLEGLPPIHHDYGKDAWDKATKDARVKALFATIEACESVMVAIMRDLRATGDVSPNYSRQVKMPWQ